MVEMSAAVEQHFHEIHEEKLHDTEPSILKVSEQLEPDIRLNGESEVHPSVKSVNVPSIEIAPTIRYSREELLILEKADLAILRPDFLSPVFDRDGRWDPMAWHSGKALAEVEVAPVGTLEFRKRTRSNAADTKDVDVILSPQRMSFGSGCAGSKVVPGADVKRQNGLSAKNKFDKNSERTRDPEREKHLQKINGSYSGNREQIRKAIRDLHENRDRNKDGAPPSKEDEPEQWIRGGGGNGGSEPEHFKSDYRPPNTKYANHYNGNYGNGNKRQWNPRRYSERSVEDEPEWFSAGPTSRLDTIELKGFEDDDKLHSEADISKEEGGSKGRMEELAMDPLGNPEMTSASNQYANDSMYSTGLQEDWDPTNPKFNVQGLLDPHAFLEEGKDLLEAEKSMTMPPNPVSNRLPIDFWGNASSSPKEYGPGGGVPRPVSSPAARPCKENIVPCLSSEVHFGENVATSSLKSILGVNDPHFGAEVAKLGMNGPPAPGSAPPFFDVRNGPRPPLNIDDPIVRQLLHNDRTAIKPPGAEMLLRPEMLQNPNIPRNIREMLLQRSQSEMLPSPGGGGMLPHPGPVPPRLPGPADQLLRDPRLADPRIVDPRLVDPRFLKPEFGLPSPTQVNPAVKQGPHRNGHELLNAVKNDPAQLDKVINVLQNTLKLGQAPPETQPAMTALLRDMEKAKSDNIKLQTLQILAGTHPQSLGKPPGEQIHDKTQALKALLRLPGQGPPLMTAPARIAPAPPHHPADVMRPRNPGEEGIPTRITHHHERQMMGNKPGFPMAFTPTSVMIKSSEIRNMIKPEDLDQHHINLTPSHMQPHHMQPHHNQPHHNPRFQQQRSAEIPGFPTNGKKSPRFDEGLRPVPTIETARNNVPKLHFGGPPPFSPHHQIPLKGLPPALVMQQIAKGVPPQSPHGHHHMPSQLLMQELMHSNNKPPFPPHLQVSNNKPPPFPPHLQHAAANGIPR